MGSAIQARQLAFYGASVGRPCPIFNVGLNRYLLSPKATTRNDYMPIEVEQKFRVLDHAAIQRILADLNAGPGETVEQVDRYFNHPARDFAKTDEALRLRRVGPRNYITFKGPKLDATTKTRREIEVEFSSGDESASEAAALLEALGFKPVAQVHKRRTHMTVRWEGREVGVALDEVDTLGSFVELELMAMDREVAQARDCLVSLAQRLGLSNTERRSYLELLLQRG
jgi:adenylate cyclase class 2